MFLTDRKLDRRISEVKNYRYRNAINMKEFVVCEDEQGVDVNHKEVFFPEELYGTTFSLTFRLWSGLEGGGVPRPQEHKIAQADLACLDEKADDFYYMATANTSTPNSERGDHFFQESVAWLKI